MLEGSIQLYGFTKSNCITYNQDFGGYSSRVDAISAIQAAGQKARAEGFIWGAEVRRVNQSSASVGYTKGKICGFAYSIEDGIDAFGNLSPIRVEWEAPVGQKPYCSCYAADALILVDGDKNVC